MRLNKLVRETCEFLTKPKVVKFSWIGAVVTWVGSIIIALLIAQLDPVGPTPDPAGFNPLINYISDLGNQDLTPMPIILNWAMMNTALLMISPSSAICRALPISLASIPNRAARCRSIRILSSSLISS